MTGMLSASDMMCRLSTQLGRPRSVPEDTDVIRRGSFRLVRLIIGVISTDAGTGAPLLHGASELARSSINRLQLVIRLRQLMVRDSQTVGLCR